MAGRDDYGSCCRDAARDPEAVFCPVCAHPLFRCTAPGCPSLIAPFGHCPSCVDLRLSLEKGAILKARLGECLSVPFVLTNASPSRSLAVKAVLRAGSDAAQEPVRIAWEQLDAGRSRSFAVPVGPFAHGGIDNLRLTMVVSAAFDDLEETYAFSGDVAIDVEGADPTQVVQNFNLTGADFGTAGMVVANPHAGTGTHRRREEDALASRTAIPLERAERHELENGCRGYKATGARMPRDVRFVYAGFPAQDKPSDGPLLQRPVIRCGRNSRASDSKPAAQPNDLCLRVYDAASGSLDREASAGISRRLCDFVLQDDRLHARAVGGSGLAINGEAIEVGALRVVEDGDTFTVSAANGRTLVFRAAFKASGNVITQVRFDKAS